MEFKEFIKPELLILIPVLYLIGEGVKKTEIPCRFIPSILGATGVLLSMVYVVASAPIIGTQALASALFSGITQGVLVAGASVYTNEIIKQSKKED